MENKENSIKDFLEDYESEDIFIDNNKIANELNENDVYDLNMSEIIKERWELILFYLLYI